MRKIVLIILSLAAIGSTQAEQTNTKANLEQEAKQKIKLFAGELKTALVSAIQSNGLISAVQVCNEQAPKIAEKLSIDGWNVARTSLKTRNSNNLADAWEEKVMLNFDEKLQAGEKVENLSMSQLNNNQYRFMKAIPTAQVCVACHGDSLSPELRTKIKSLYPRDLALGYKVGDIRGAFTLSKQLEN